MRRREGIDRFVQRRKRGGRGREELVCRGIGGQRSLDRRGRGADGLGLGFGVRGILGFRRGLGLERDGGGSFGQGLKRPIFLRAGAVELGGFGVGSLGMSQAPFGQSELGALHGGQDAQVFVDMSDGGSALEAVVDLCLHERDNGGSDRARAFFIGDL